MFHLIKGDFHFHSLHSSCHGMHTPGLVVNYKTDCGANAIKEIIKVSNSFSKLGYKYLAITNHPSSPTSTKVANTKDIALFNEHITKIKEINKQNIIKVKLLAGAEINIINEYGKLSLPNNILKQLDVVIASNHRNTNKLSKAKIRQSFMRTILNNNVHIIGHLTRFIKKLNYQDWEVIIAQATKHKKIIEFNLRAPFNKEILKLIVNYKTLVSIGSDTHPEIIIEEHNSIENYAKSYHTKINDTATHLIKQGINKNRIINLRNSHKLKTLSK